SRVGRRAGGVPERDPGGDGALARARGGGAVTAGTSPAEPAARVIFDVQADAEAAAQSAAERLAAVAAAGGHVALSGGATPALAYRLAALADWSRAHVWWGDDR